AGWCSPAPSSPSAWRARSRSARGAGARAARTESAPRGKRGRPLLTDRRQALAHVLLHEGQHLEGDRLVEDRPRLAEPVVERALRPADRLLRAAGEAVADLQRLRQHLLGGEAEAHEADAFGLAAVEELGGE